MKFLSPTLTRVVKATIFVASDDKDLIPCLGCWWLLGTSDVAQNGVFLEVLVVGHMLLMLAHVELHGAEQGRTQQHYVAGQPHAVETR